MSNTRKSTERILDLIADGLLDNQVVLQELLGYLSEADVADFLEHLIDMEYTDRRIALNQ
jgi:phage/plasmid-associated DNA primase